MMHPTSLKAELHEHEQLVMINKAGTAGVAMTPRFKCKGDTFGEQYSVMAWDGTKWIEEDILMEEECNDPRAEAIAIAQNWTTDQQHNRSI